MPDGGQTWPVTDRVLNFIQPDRRLRGRRGRGWPSLPDHGDAGNIASRDCLRRDQDDLGVHRRKVILTDEKAAKGLTASVQTSGREICHLFSHRESVAESLLVKDGRLARLQPYRVATEVLFQFAGDGLRHPAGVSSALRPAMRDLVLHPARNA